MKRIISIAMILIVLTGSVGIGTALGDSESLGVTLKTYNEDAKDTAYEQFRVALVLYLQASEADKPLYVEMMHWYSVIYEATNRLELPLSAYKLTELGVKAETVYMEEISVGRIPIDEYEFDQWKKYLNGEITSNEYVSYLMDMVATFRDAEEKVQEDIDGGKK